MSFYDVKERGTPETPDRPPAADPGEPMAAAGWRQRYCRRSSAHRGLAAGSAATVAASRSVALGHLS